MWPRSCGPHVLHVARIRRRRDLGLDGGERRVELVHLQLRTRPCRQTSEFHGLRTRAGWVRPGAVNRPGQPDALRLGGVTFLCVTFWPADVSAADVSCGRTDRSGVARLRLRHMAEVTCLVGHRWSAADPGAGSVLWFGFRLAV